MRQFPKLTPASVWIPAQLVRLAGDRLSPHKPLVLQQLWRNRNTDQTEWRTVPVEYVDAGELEK